MEQGNSIFGTQRISKLLLKLAPPIMAAQLIQALYNIVDSYFIGNFQATVFPPCPSSSLFSF